MDQKNLYFNKKNNNFCRNIKQYEKGDAFFYFILKKKKKNIMIYFVLFWDLDKIQKPYMRF